ncbi:Hypothetical protein SRAE_X000045500 [Strongyloides ratti]|uniref:Uncharacterized protein n=1 Tax=Strongyloides ratti TaxID=34506 RepID=A0A090N0R1_STRRB|nr:Hypothetical protein SRAE_X000045500 [Strongyloides ratti]CEF71128.1 Hypothetical protein SRAE_X000045500 [Strongyloides ratti]
MKAIILLFFYSTLIFSWSIDDYLTDCWGNECRDNVDFLQKMPIIENDENKYVHISYKTLRNGLITFGPVIPFEGIRYCMLYVENGKTIKDCQQTRIFNRNSFDSNNCIFSSSYYKGNDYQLESRLGRIPVQINFDNDYFYGYLDKYTNCVYFPDVYDYKPHIISLDKIEKYISYLYCKT